MMCCHGRRGLRRWDGGERGGRRRRRKNETYKGEEKEKKTRHINEEKGVESDYGRGSGKTRYRSANGSVGGWIKVVLEEGISR